MGQMGEAEPVFSASPLEGMRTLLWQVVAVGGGGSMIVLRLLLAAMQAGTGHPRVGVTVGVLAVRRRVEAHLVERVIAV